eukprot:11124324-Alexandrium_andersonii.AAC.1
MGRSTKFRGVLLGGAHYLPAALELQSRQAVIRLRDVPAATASGDVDAREGVMRSCCCLPGSILAGSEGKHRRAWC